PSPEPAADDVAEIDPEVPTVDVLTPGDATPDDPTPDAAPVGFPPFVEFPAETQGITRLGQSMVDRGLITKEDLERALEHQRETRKRLGEALIEIGAVTSFQVSQALAEHLGVPFVDLELHPPDVMLAGMIPEEVARRYCALPVERWSGQVVVAMANPN